MKVLVIGHTYISKVGREKWRELIRLFGVELRIVVPSLWKDYLFAIRYSDQRDEELPILARKVFFAGKEAAHFYLDPTFTLASFKPDILHVEEGTDALSFRQALWARRLFSPRTKSLFFTWMNWVKKVPQPFRAFERYNLAHADAAICGNADAEKILRDKGFRKPVTVMPLLGVDPQLFSSRDASALKSSLDLRGFVIGFAGRFVPEKGVLDLIEAASRLREEYTLLFVGGGELEGAMRALAAERGIAGRLRIVPSVPHGAVPNYLNCMDTLVLPSYTVAHWKEQFGQVLVQAMACGVPVIGSSHAEIPRVIGEAGLVFEERNIVGLTHALSSMIGGKERREELKITGRRRVLELYTNTKIAEQTHRVYLSLLN